VQQFPATNSFADASEALTTLLYGEHNHQTVVVDSASALEPLIWTDVCECKKVQTIEEVGGGYGKGYTEALYRWRYLTQQLDLLRTHKQMASIIIGHVTVKRFDDPQGASYDQYQFDVHAKAAAMLYRWADVILFANTKVIVKTEDVGFKKEHKIGVDLTGGTRFLYTQKSPSHPGGGRGVYGRLPYELPLSWQAFRDAVGQVMNPEVAA
jgi:hypothetical protein